MRIACCFANLIQRFRSGVGRKVLAASSRRNPTNYYGRPDRVLSSARRNWRRLAFDLYPLPPLERNSFRRDELHNFLPALIPRGRRSSIPKMKGFVTPARNGVAPQFMPSKLYRRPFARTTLMLKRA